MQFILCNTEPNGMETKMECSHRNSDTILECSACTYFIIGFKWPEKDSSPTSSQVLFVPYLNKQFEIKIASNM